MKNQNLVTFRKNRDLTVSEMAERVGVSTSYYEKIEYGDRNPSYKFLTKFKLAFPESNTDYIFLPNNHTLCVDK